MKLITKAISQRFKELGSQENVADPVVVAKFFLPGHSATWYAISYDEIQEIFFGYVVGLQFDEWGYFSRAELEGLRSPFGGLPVERDLYTPEKTVSQHYPEIKEEIERRREMLAIEAQREKERDNDLQR